MIAQFKSIIRVGKFRSFNAQNGSQHELKKRAVIFGRNTRGKSTLTAVVKSISENNPDYVIGRKSFGSSEPPKVIIKETTSAGSQAHVYENGSWRSTMPNIRIFDSKYVRHNVHTEEAVLSDHQTKLEALILGREGEELRSLLEAADKACKDNSERKTVLTNEYNRYLRQKTGVDFQAFIKVVPDVDVENKINLQKLSIESYKKYDDIKKALSEIDALIDGWDFSEVVKSLVPTLEVSQSTIKDHIAHNLKQENQALEFLHAGYDQLTGNGCCPFCSQKIRTGKPEELISELSTLFSDSYRTLRQAIKSAETYVERFEPDRVLDDKVKRVNDLGEKLEIGECLSRVATARDQLLEEIRRKKDDYNHPFDATILDVLNVEIDATRVCLNKSKGKYAADFDTARLTALNEELVRLETVKERSSQSWVGNCDEYTELAKATPALNKTRDDALQNKNKYARDIFDKYSGEINAVLSALNAQFKIIDLHPRATIRSRQPLYALEFAGGHQVNISSASVSEACFENTLSESDKRLLGFAFFVAEVKFDTDKSNLVLILDDPMSSFDTERKLATAKILSDISEEVEQIIVLTHEEGFLKVLHKHFSECALFKIVANDSTNSSIDTMDINDEYLEPHYKSITLLEDIAQGAREASPDDLRCMRDITEAIMLRKYYALLKNDHRDGKSASTFMSTLKTAGVYDDATIKDINNLYLHFWNHDDSAKVVTRDDYSPGDLQAIAQQFLAAIHKL